MGVLTATRTRQPVTIATLAGAAVGAGSVWHPLATIGAALVACAVAALRLATTTPRRFFIAPLAVALAGYAFFSRGFAYLGVKPIFIGELVLGLGVLVVLAGRERFGALASPVVALLAAFATLGLLRTVPFVGVYGFDALRDAALWGYGAFALLAAIALFAPGRLVRLSAIYDRLLPYFLGWVPILAVVTTYGGDRLPSFGGDATFPTYKPDDVGVHLAGIAAFLMLDLGKHRGRESSTGTKWREWACWALFAADFVITATVSRSGTLAIFAAVGIAVLARPARLARRLAAVGGIGAVVAAAVLGTLELTGAKISLDHKGLREFSADQLISNVTSVFGDKEDKSGLDGSRTWRLMWWHDITNYTVHGKYFWTGKGFGVNLADDDGYQVTSDKSLRSPHNVNMTILARMGVPGIVAWLVLQVGFAVTMIRGIRRATRRGAEWWARLELWILAYWLAFIVDASFDVFLEGPAGGIWFWTLMGIGLAATRLDRPRVDRPRARDRAPAIAT